VERAAGGLRLWHEPGPAPACNRLQSREAQPDGPAWLEVDSILLGAGRVPNVEGLGLEAAGVEHDAGRGVHVDDRLRTTNRRIWAAGDVCSRFKFTHLSDALARIAIRNALFGGRAKASDLVVPWCTYTDPEVAHVGLREREVRLREPGVRTFVQELRGVDRAVIDGEDEGFVKVYVRERGDRILGATIVARHAGEMLPELTLAIVGGLGLGELARTIHAYPTRAEAIRKVADAWQRTRLTPAARRLLRWWLELRRPWTLAIDVGGSGVKAAVLEAGGRPVADRLRVKTPQPAPPAVLVETIAGLAAGLPDFDRVSVGFPGAVRDGVVLVAANLGSDEWHGFDLAAALAERLGKPVRILNDADVQGLGVIEGRGLEMVLTLGTGFGTALFVNGRPAPHLELAHHAFRRGHTYEEELGEKALRKAGRRKWNKRLRIAIETLRRLVNFDRLYIGGGNARKIDFDPDPDTTVVSNEAGVLGGIALWREAAPVGSFRTALPPSS
jgi:polyphosphate glucokinase